jgi:cytochrome oxidase Cu insertion factor (SCO1/SenC/PrrC family)
MNSLAVRGWLLLAVVLALAYGGWTAYRLRPVEMPPRVHAVAGSQPDKPIADFTLTDQSGEPFSSAALRGQVWVASFFFASCPGPCRQMNQSLAAIAGQVPGDVRFVSVTCDPENDTPDTLTRYAKLFDADPDRWKFLTGEMRDLKHIGNDIFQVVLEKGSHYQKAFVVDRQGIIRGQFDLLDADELAKMKQMVIELDAGAAAPQLQTGVTQDSAGQTTAMPAAPIPVSASPIFGLAASSPRSN